MLEPITHFSVIASCANGKQLLETLNQNIKPDIVLMDISMKEMNGFETTLTLSEYYPFIKVIGYSMHDSLETVQLMLQNGAYGFLSKSSELFELKDAIENIYHKGFYYNQFVSKQLFNKIKKNKTENILTKKELVILPYLCSDDTYKIIAEKLHISIKTIDRHKENICKKMKVKTRAGLTALAAKIGLIN